jgi:hypothetical protein
MTVSDSIAFRLREAIFPEHDQPRGAGFTLDMYAEVDDGRCTHSI